MICIGFTPDEEVGKGADMFDVEGFGADYAYTVDEGPLGPIEYENFNAAGVKIKINGRGIHPGEAKGKMVNSITVCFLQPPGQSIPMGMKSLSILRPLRDALRAQRWSI